MEDDTRYERLQEENERLQTLIEKLSNENQTLREDNADLSAQNAAYMQRLASLMGNSPFEYKSSAVVDHANQGTHSDVDDWDSNDKTKTYRVEMEQTIADLKERIMTLVQEKLTMQLSIEDLEHQIAKLQQTEGKAAQFEHLASTSNISNLPIEQSSHPRKPAKKMKKKEERTSWFGGFLSSSSTEKMTQLSSSSSWDDSNATLSDEAKCPCDPINHSISLPETDLVSKEMRSEEVHEGASKGEEEASLKAPGNSGSSTGEIGEPYPSTDTQRVGVSLDSQGLVIKEPLAIPHLKTMADKTSDWSHRKSHGKISEEDRELWSRMTEDSPSKILEEATRGRGDLGRDPKEGQHGIANVQPRRSWGLGFMRRRNSSYEEGNSKELGDVTSDTMGISRNRSGSNSSLGSKGKLATGDSYNHLTLDANGTFMDYDDSTHSHESVEYEGTPNVSLLI